MQKTNGDKITHFGIALLSQLAMHCVRSLLLNTVSTLLSTSPALPYVYGILSLILKIAVFMIPTFIYLKLNEIPLTDLLTPSGKENTKETPSLNKIIQFIAAASITLNAANLTGIATEYLYKALGLTPSPSALPEDPILQLISLVSAVILAPLLEELLFRGASLNALFDFGKRGILLSGLLFALMHYSVYSLLYAFVAGCLIAYFSKRTNSLKTAVGLHFINNLITFVSLLMGFYISQNASTLFGYILTAITLPIAVFGIVMLIKEANSKSPAPKQENTPKLSPGIILYILISAILCAMTR